MRQLTWIRRAIREGATLTVATTSGGSLIHATLIRVWGGGLSTRGYTTPEGALLELEILLKEDAAVIASGAPDTHR